MEGRKITSSLTEVRTLQPHRCLAAGLGLEFGSFLVSKRECDKLQE